MAPRKPSEDTDDASSLASEVLKPKTAKAKVTKPKADKPKVEKIKVEKVKKEPAAKKTKAAAVAAAVDGDFDGEEEVVKVKKVVVKKETVKKEPAKDKDGKEKVKAVNGEEAVQLMLVYLKEQNRPYSATEVSANLHGKVTKTVADKLLKEMENSRQIMGKATKKDGGGQWVFWALQDAADFISPEELAAMESEIAALKESLPALKATHKATTSKLNNLLSAPTTTELVVIVQQLQVENKAKSEKLQGFQSGSIKMVTKEDLDRTEKEHKYWGARRRARKEAQKVLMGMLRDGMTDDMYAEKMECLDEDPYVVVG